jgi:two-component system NtrC family sensor kinase
VQVVADVLGLVRNQASFHNIVIESDLVRGTPPVMADRDQLCQVVLNIVLNAAEAMPKGGSLWLASRTADERKRVVLEITDNGPGIPPEIRDRIFEPFFTTKKTGTGLGLSIAYGILEQHGGTLQVQSPPEGGTTILVTLPASSGVAA